MKKTVIRDGKRLRQISPESIKALKDLLGKALQDVYIENELVRRATRVKNSHGLTQDFLSALYRHTRAMTIPLIKPVTVESGLTMDQIFGPDDPSAGGCGQAL